MKTKYDRVKEDIVSKIQNGTYKNGEQLPSQDKLAKVYDVSKITIKKATAELFNRKLIIKEPGRKGFFIAKQNNKMSKSIAVIIGDITSYYESNILKGLEKALWKRQFNMVVCNSNRSLDKVQDFLDNIDLHAIDGIVYIPVIEENYLQENRQVLNVFDEYEKPYVLIDQLIHGVASNVVMVNHRLGSYTLVDNLIRDGYKNILVGLGSDCYSIEERLRGVQDAFSTHKVQLTPNRIIRTNDSLFPLSLEQNPEQYEQLKQAILNAGHFDAIYAANNRVMNLLISMMLSLGIDLRQVKIALQNKLNKPIPPYTDSIYYVDSQLEILGFETGKLLLNLLFDEERNAEVTTTITVQGRFIKEG